MTPELAHFQQTTRVGVNGIDRQTLDFYTPTRFCLRPEHLGDTPLEQYCDCCNQAELFSQTEYHETFVVDAGLNLEQNRLFVLALGIPQTEEDRREYFLFSVRFEPECDCFVYSNPKRYYEDEEEKVKNVFAMNIGEKAFNDAAPDPDHYLDEYL